MLQGWISVRAFGPRYPVRLVVEEVGEAVPIGWTVYIFDVPFGSAYLDVRPGSVFRIGAMPQVDPATALALHGNDIAQTPQVSAGTGETTADGSFPVASSAEVQDAMSPSGSRAPADADVQQDATHSTSTVSMPCFGVFVVLVPGYAPEVLPLPLTFPTTVPFVRASLQEHRTVQAHRRFPILVETTPQPDTTFGTFVAVPDWDLSGAVVVIDARLCGKQLYATLVPSQVDRSALLALAGFPTTAQYVVYVQDLPWALQEQQTARLAHGDLVLIAFLAHPTIVSASLSDMLLSATGWASYTAALPPLANTFWIVGAPFRANFRLPDVEVSELRGIVATSLAMSERDVSLIQPLPSVADHSSHGIVSAGLFLVRAVADSHMPPVSVPCLLDLRPIFGDIEQVYLPQGVLDATFIVNAHLPSVPFGYSLGVFAGHHSSGDTVTAGTVVTVEYLTDRDREHLLPLLVGVGIPPGRLPASYSNTWAYSGRGPWDTGLTGSASGHDPSALGLRLVNGVDRARVWFRAAFRGLIVPRDCRGLPSRQGRRRRRPQFQVGPLRLALLVSCFMTQPRGLLAHPSHSLGRPLGQAASLWLLLADAPSFAVAVQSRPVSGLVPLSIAEFVEPSSAIRDMCASGHKDNACAFRPLRDTSIPAELQVSCHGSRPIPTPCRHKRQLQLSMPGPTLLTEALQHPECQAFFLTRTLIETLEEFFAEDGKDTVSQPRTLSLEAAVPLSSYQEQVQSLADIVPGPPVLHPSHPQAPQDWLDTDLSVILCDPEFKAAWKQALRQVQSWHCSYPSAVTQLLVYTDGSAPSGCTKRGSFEGPAAWAFAVWAVTVDSLFFLGGCAHTAVPADSPFYLGECADDALNAELLALAWALIWALEYGSSFGVPIEFRYDALSAGGGVFASSRPIELQALDSGMSVAAFATALRQTLESRVSLHHVHVKGHSGDVGNEVCDCLSRHVRRAPESYYQRCLPTWPKQWRLHPLASWGWLVHQSRPDLPSLCALEAEASRLQSASQPDPIPPCLGVQAQHSRAADIDYCFKAMTFNVLSLFTADMPKGKKKRTEGLGLLIAGKRDVIKAQLLAHNFLFVGLQETRLPASGTLPDKDFWMISESADAAGQGGCALWINKSVPYASDSTGPLYIRSEHLTVCASSCRHIVVQVTAPRLRLLVLVAHAPRGPLGSPACPKVFWDGRLREFHHRAAGSEFLILTDANAHVGSVETSAIRAAGAECENPAGEIFHEFLLDIQAFVPATSPQCHVGQHWTWKAPGPQGAEHRIDFVVVPESWEPFCVKSWIWQDFESLQIRQDHCPACLAVQFIRQAPAVAYLAHRRRVFRPNVPADQDQLLKAKQALLCGPPIAWDLPIDRHFHAWTQSMHKFAAPLCAPTDLNPTQTYITAPTLDLVRRKRGVRIYLRQEEAERKRRLLMVGFAAFLHHSQGTAFTSRATAVAEAWLQDVDVSLARALDLYQELAVALKCAVKRDRLSYLENLQAQVTLQDLRDPRALYAAVRKAFPTAKAARRTAFQPLPAVLLQDGTMAVDTEARLKRWREHFGEQESGLELSPDEYLSHFSQPDIPVLSQGPVFAASQMPSLADLEAQILSLKKRKAAGPDGITAEVLQVWVAGAAAHLFPVCLKACIGLREPTEWRGGTLMSLAKRVAKAAECGAYRSIMLENVSAKLYHRLIRANLVPCYSAFKHDTSAGQLPKVGVDNIGLLVRTYQLWSMTEGRKCALTFFDVKAAFYRVIRQALVSTNEEKCGESFMKLLHTLGVPPSAIQELFDHLIGLNILADAGASPFLQAQVADLFRGSWFRLQYDGALVLTRKGSRPGDPLADLLFGFTFAAYVRSVEQALATQNLGTAMPVLDDTPPWHSWEATTSAGLPSWADDFVFLQNATEDCALVRRVVGATELIVSHASVNGMQLTFAVDKTALLLDGRCNKAAVSQIFTDSFGVQGCDVRDAVTNEVHFLPIVDSYRHLGCIAVASATPVPEIKFRNSQASAVLKPLRKRLFSAGIFPLPLRRLLLQSLVMSRYVFASATTIMPIAAHRRLWYRHFVQLWRGLHRCVDPSQTPHSFQILKHAKAPSPILAIARARASFLTRMLASGPCALLHLLHAHWRVAPQKSWLGQLTLDVKAVAVYVSSARTLQQMPCVVTALIEACQSDPQWWPSQVQLAVKGYLKDLELWDPQKACVQPPPVSGFAGTQAFFCDLCGAGFPLRKHLGAHLAKSHGQLSPSRHFALSEYCLACHRFYHSISRVQNHLRQSRSCLLRVVHLVRPLTVAELRSVEAADKARSRKIAKGQWTAFLAAAPASIAFGPRLPLYSEAIAGLTEAELTVERLQRLYRPSPSVLHWITQHVDAASHEEDRHTSLDFWLSRPVCA